MAKMRVGIGLLATVALTAVVAAEAAAPRISVRPPPQPLRVGQEWAVQVSVRGARPSRFVVQLGARGRALPCCAPAVATVRGSRFRRPVAGATASVSAHVTGSSEASSSVRRFPG